MKIAAIIDCCVLTVQSLWRVDMNNQVKLELNREQVVEFLKTARADLTEDDWKDADVITVLQWALPAYQKWTNNGTWNDTPPVPTIGCSECDYKGYFEYETGVVDEGTGIKEIAKEPCDCVIDRVPTIKPGDKVRHDDWGDGVVYDLDEDDAAIAIVDFDDEGLMSIHCDELEVVE